MANNVLTTAEAATIISERLLPASMPPRTSRSISRLCMNGEIPGAYRAYGDWCIPAEGLEQFIAKSKEPGALMGATSGPKSKSEQRRIAIQKEATNGKVGK